MTARRSGHERGVTRYAAEQWAAAKLMACRILESTVRLHVKKDLNASDNIFADIQFADIQYENIKRT
ncbi:MAG: hypothetical protein LBE17_05770 [Treponema sp.]|jgi:hypothetical protein|nr:hypothetical protein [Treponema sp.]